jgi:hypothetical protein
MALKLQKLLFLFCLVGLSWILKKKATAYTNAICLIFSINGLHLTVKQRQSNSCGNTPSQSSTSQNPDRPRSVLSKHFLGIIFQIFRRMRQNKLCQQNFQQLDGCVFDTVDHRHISRQTKGPKRCYIKLYFFVRLGKAAGAETSGEMRDEKLHAVVVRNTFGNKMS